MGTDEIPLVLMADDDDDDCTLAKTPLRNPERTVQFIVLRMG